MVGVYRNGNSVINNTGTIQAIASATATITYFNDGGILWPRASAIGVYGRDESFGLVNNAAGATISATASQIATVDNFEGLDIYAPATLAGGVIVSRGSVVENRGTITATATTTLNASNGSPLNIGGAEGYIPYNAYANPTSGAVGIAVDHNATIRNFGTVTATASLGVTLTNVSGARIGSADEVFGYGGEYYFYTPPGAQAVGIYVGSQVNGYGEGYQFGGVSNDLVVNHGTVTAVASSIFTLTNSADALVQTYSSAAGILAQYMDGGYAEYNSPAQVLGRVAITNHGTVNATATTSLGYTIDGSMSPGEGSEFSLRSAAIGIGAVGTTGWSYNYTCCGGPEGGPLATIVNHGTVNATATTTANLSISNYYGEFHVDARASAVGIGAASAWEYNGKNPYPIGGADIMNAGTVNATATAAVALTYNGSASWGEIGFNGYIQANATGIASDVASTVQNFGTVNATANAGLTLNSTHGYIGFGGETRVRAESTGIGGAEGFSPFGDAAGGRLVQNHGAVNATANAVAVLNLTGSYGEFNFIDVSANSNAIEIDRTEASIVNAGTVTSLSNASLTLNLAATSTGCGDENLEACSSQAYLNARVDAHADGIGADGDYGQIQNSGPVTVTANASLAINASGQSYVGFGGEVTAYAHGMWVENYGVIENSGDVTATATARADVTYSQTSGGAPIHGLYIESSAYAISGGEGARIVNDANLNVTATSLLNITGPGYFDGGEISLNARARGIEVDGSDYMPFHVTNNGTITALALSAVKITNTGEAMALDQQSGPQLRIEAYAYGIDGGYGTGAVYNNGTIIAVASSTLTLIGFTGEGGNSNVYMNATAYGIEMDGGFGSIIENTGTIYATATVTVTAPDYIYLGLGNVHATAYGIAAWSSDGGTLITNKGSIFATAYVTLPGGAEGYNNSYNGYGYFWDHGAGDSSERPARAYGIRAPGNSAVVNDGQIWANSYVSIGGTVLTGAYDPSSSFGVYLPYQNIFTNNGIVGTSRVGPMHWAVFMAGDGYNSQFYNYGTTVGSIHVGHGSAENYGTMRFRTLQPSDGILQTAENQGNAQYHGELWARYGTYDRIVVHPYASFDTTNGTILIQPLGNVGLYGERNRFRYFVDCGDSTNCNNVAGLTTGANVNLKSTSAFLVPTLDTVADPYGSTSGYDLILTRLPFTNPNLPGNQGTLGGGLEGLFGAVNGGDPNGPLATLLAKIQVLGPGDVPGAYQQLAGEIIANASQLGYANAGQLLGMLFGRLNEFRGGAMSSARNVQFASRDFDIAQAPPGASRSSTAIPGTGRWMGFVSGYGQTGQVDSSAGISGARFNVAGGMAGIEYSYSEAVRIGFTIGAGSAWTRLRDLDSRANGTFFQGAIYGSYAPGPWYVDGALGYARHSIDTKRTVAFPGFVDNLEGSTTANQFIGGFETGWRFDAGRFQVTPFFGMQMSVFSQDGYTESGGVAALNYESETSVSARSSLGVQVRTTFRLGETMRIDPYARVAWAHEFGDRSATVTASFVGAPTSSFRVTGARRDRDTFLLGAGFEMTVTPTIGVFAGYSGDVSSTSTSHAGSAGLRIRW
ncbi:MAG: autotransporter outer membrane beta-barrel domain-containing protein [Alphaproteobacteria bacterium]